MRKKRGGMNLSLELPESYELPGSWKFLIGYLLNSRENRIFYPTNF